MRALSALIALAVLLGIVYVGVGLAGQEALFGVVIPYAAIVIFLVGLTYRILRWAGAPVPYRIPTTCGQEVSLPWIEARRLENPPNTFWTVLRMAFEVLLFRSLFRNTRFSLRPGQNVVHEADKWLWAGALAFHWSFLVVFVRHLRFFIEPTPVVVGWLEAMDGFFQLAVPTLFLTDIIIVAALLYLLGRRFLNPLVRYISLPADYLAPLLLLTIAVTGILMRYFTKVDLVAAKELALGLVTLKPFVPHGIGLPFYIHVFFVSVLFAYFPFSKLMHMGGVFLSPTRNLANDNRRRRHVNPQNPEVEVHAYEQWEDEFRDKIKGAGIPLERGES
jgi:nitrate reductase gamma subunit